MQGMGERPGGDPYAYLLAARAADVSTRRRRVIVVGAGMAGLGAAEALAGSGLEVLVLEASDRVGGRVWGERFGGLAADLGAMFVEGTSRDNPMVRLMERYGLAQRRQPRRRVCFDQGQRLGRAEAIEASQALRSGLEPLSSCGGTGEPNNCYSHLDALAAADQALDGGLPDPYPADGALASSSRVRRLSNELRGKELYYGAGLGDLSARWFGYDEDFGGSHSPIEGGYHAIPALLARGLADAPNVQICLNTRVMKVRSEQGDGMSVECERCTHRADYVIVTCSLGVLKAGLIQFEPPLPAAHQSAIERLGFGGQDHLILQFESRFWDDCAVINIVAQTDPISAVEFFFPFPTDCAPVIVAFIPRHAAMHWCGRPDDQIVDAALAALTQAYGDQVTPLVRSKYSRWFSDPNFLGGYSHLSVESSPADFDALAEPIDGRLFLAGCCLPEPAG